MQASQRKDIGRACRVLGISRNSLRYVSVKNDSVLITRLNKLAEEYPVEGFWKCYHRIRNAGEIVNHKRLHRVYKSLGLPLRRKCKKRLPERVKEPLEVPPSFTHTWSIDFMSDALISGRKFRSFNVIDDFNREILHIENDYSMKSNRVIWVLNHLVKRFGKPQKIRMDNGPELISAIIRQWSEIKGIDFKYIQPGKPTQNAYIERFNKTYRQNVLDAYLFQSIDEVRNITQQWMNDYNYLRPHDALKGLPPAVFRKQFETIQNLDYVCQYQNNKRKEGSWI